jgi:ABC-2 type transport system permease protein
LLAYLIPMGFVVYFPALYVLDKPDPLGLPRFLQFSSPVIAVAAALVAGAMWRFAVRHYRSAGG